MDYFLSPTAISNLGDHKKWSLNHFAYSVTKKYFQDMDKGFQYIAAILRQTQDIPNIINEKVAIFQRELAQYGGKI